MNDVYNTTLVNDNTITMHELLYESVITPSCMYIHYFSCSEWIDSRSGGLWLCWHPIASMTFIHESDEQTTVPRRRKDDI